MAKKEPKTQKGKNRKFWSGNGRVKSPVEKAEETILGKRNAAKKGPKTLRGIERKLMTGDGRKKHSAEKLVEEAFGIKEKKVKKKK